MSSKMEHQGVRDTKNKTHMEIQRTNSNCIIYSPPNSQSRPSSPVHTIFGDPSQLSRPPSPIHAISGDSIQLPWILDHILQGEIKDELPLRIMFSFNAGHHVPTLKQAHAWWGDSDKGKKVIQFMEQWDTANPYRQTQGAARLKALEEMEKSSLNKGTDHYPSDKYMYSPMPSQIAEHLRQTYHNDRRQSLTLPADACKRTIEQSFPVEYFNFVYASALAGLDYLREFETRRRCALREAASQLQITKSTWRDRLDLIPEAKYWIESVQQQELATEALYANIYIDIRIWTMVKQLEEVPWDKHECIALLNTLFPPGIENTPNDAVPKATMHKYRALFYRYMQKVEAGGTRNIGPEVLKPFVSQLLKAGSGHSWSDVREDIRAYMELADLMIEQANAASHPHTGSHGFFLDREDDSLHTRTGSNAVSDFSDRPGTVSSATTSVDEITLKRESKDSTRGSWVENIDHRGKSNQGGSDRPPSTRRNRELRRNSRLSSESRETSIDRELRLNPRTSFHSFSRPSTPALEARRMRGESTSRAPAPDPSDSFPRTSTTSTGSSEYDPSQYDLRQIPTATSSYSQTRARRKSSATPDPSNKMGSFSFLRKIRSKADEPESMERSSRNITPEPGFMDASKPPGKSFKLSSAISWVDRFPGRDDQTNTKSALSKSPNVPTKMTEPVRHRHFIDNQSMFLDEDDEVPPVPPLTGLGLKSIPNFSGKKKKAGQISATDFPAPSLQKKAPGKNLRKIKSLTGLKETSNTQDIATRPQAHASGSFSFGVSPYEKETNRNRAATTNSVNQRLHLDGRFSKSTTALPSQQDTKSAKRARWILPDGRGVSDYGRFKWTDYNSIECKTMEINRDWAILTSKGGRFGLSREIGEPKVMYMEDARGSQDHGVPKLPKVPNVPQAHQTPMALLLNKFPAVPSTSRAKKPEADHQVSKTAPLKSAERFPMPSFLRTPKPVETYTEGKTTFVVDPKFRYESYHRTLRLATENKGFDRKEEPKFAIDPKFRLENISRDRTPNLGAGPSSSQLSHLSDNTDSKRPKTAPMISFDRFPIPSFLRTPKPSLETYQEGDSTFTVDPKFKYETFHRTPQLSTENLSQTPRFSGNTSSFEKNVLFHKRKEVVSINPESAMKRCDKSDRRDSMGSSASGTTTVSFPDETSKITNMHPSTVPNNSFGERLGLGLTSITNSTDSASSSVSNSLVFASNTGKPLPPTPRIGNKDTL